MHSTTPNTPNTLVRPSDSGTLVTDTAIIAEGTDNEHRNVIRLVRKYLTDFQDFGRVDFKSQPFETAGGTQNREIAILNREQAMFAMTLFRNNDIVVEFKKNLIRAFVEMETALTAPKLSGKELMAAALIEADQTIKALEATAQQQAQELQEAAPKAEAYDTFMDADGTYSIGNVAKMLGMSQNKLFDQLRNCGILISRGAMRNTPYQKYMHHFAVKAFDYERTNGHRGTSYTTRVQPSGIDFIRRRVTSTPALKKVA